MVLMMDFHDSDGNVADGDDDGDDDGDADHDDAVQLVLFYRFH